LWALTL